MNKEQIYQLLPHFLQNLLVTLFNIQAYKVRHGGKYRAYRKLFLENRKLDREQLKAIQKRRYRAFVLHTIKHSAYYRDLYAAIDCPEKIEHIRQLPIISKEDLRQHINKVTINTDEQMEKSKTGGTTGKSLEVKYRSINSQERFAMLNDFRSQFGYELGKKTAWFSGKKLLMPRDLRKNRFWKTDLYHHVRYYSTFHVNDERLKYYVENLIRYRPAYFVGFPSTMLEIANYGLSKGYDYPADTTKAIFPTAETITPEMRTVIESFFKTKMYNQYASSEGAPFIFECTNGNLHLELQSGVFEVLDNDEQPTQSGRLIVTSFTTEGTPLIRYDIGDSVTLEEEAAFCDCGNQNPLVKEILGRIDDYVFSPETGKIPLGNVSNTLKDVKGIIRFQVRQYELNCVELLIMKDDATYNETAEQKFIQNWRDRVGDKMTLTIRYVDDIPVEKSGKFRIVHNHIKHLL